MLFFGEKKIGEKKIGVEKCSKIAEKINCVKKCSKIGEKKKIDVKKCQNFGEKKNWREKKLVRKNFSPQNYVREILGNLKNFRFNEIFAGSNCSEFINLFNALLLSWFSSSVG